jgi:hypothetical protein
MMEARVPDLPKGSDIRRFGEVATQIDPASEQHVQKPCNRSTTSPQVIDRRCTADLAKKANPCLRIEEHKKEQGKMQHNCRCMIKLTSWGLTNRNNGETVLDRLI